MNEAFLPMGVVRLVIVSSGILSKLMVMGVGGGGVAAWICAEATRSARARRFIFGG